MPNIQKPPDPKRFEVSRSTLWFDRFMGWLIRFGGISVILAVFGIFYFVGKEVIPLFRSASVEPAGELTKAVKPAILGVDEWGEMPFVYDGADKVFFTNMASGETREEVITELSGLAITAYSYDAVHQRVALGLEDGRVGSFLVNYERTFESGNAAGLKTSITLEPWFTLEHGTGPVKAVSYGDSGAGRVIIAKRGSGADSTVSILRLGMKRSLIGKGKLSLLEEANITAELGSEALLIRASQNGAMALVSAQSGGIYYFLADSDGVSKRQ